MVRPRLHAARTALTVREWGRLAAMFGFILAVNVEARWSSNVAADPARPSGPVPES